MVSRDELQESIERIDRALAEAAPEVRNAWLVCRRELRMRRSQSERTVPAVAHAAQHFVAARGELDRGLAALSGVSAPSLEDTEK